MTLALAKLAGPVRPGSAKWDHEICGKDGKPAVIFNFFAFWLIPECVVPIEYISYTLFRSVVKCFSVKCSKNAKYYELLC